MPTQMLETHLTDSVLVIFRESNVLTIKIVTVKKTQTLNLINELGVELLEMNQMILELMILVSILLMK